MNHKFAEGVDTFREVRVLRCFGFSVSDGIYLGSVCETCDQSVMLTLGVAISIVGVFVNVIVAISTGAFTFSLGFDILGVSGAWNFVCGGVSGLSSLLSRCYFGNIC